MIKPLFDENKDKVEFYSKYISPVFDILGGLSERNKVWNIEDEMSFVVDTVDVADSLLNIIDKVSDPNSSVTLADFVNERVELVSKIQKMANSYLNFKNEDALFMELSAAALGYCANIVSTFDGVTPEENEKLGKAAVKLIGAAVTTALKDALGKDNKWTAPFGAVDAGVSVLIALVEGISEYEQKLNYYNEDGLPEDIAFKEAILDAVSGGLHDGFSNYAKGLDDVIFDVGQCIGEGFKWLDAKLSGKEDSYKFSITQKNYAECIRELAKKAEYGSTSADDYFEIDSSHVSLYAQDGNDIIKNIYPNVTIYGGHGNDGISIYEGAKSNSVFGGSGDDNINVYGNNNTIYGGSDDDRLIVTGNKNELYGEDGNDSFMIKGGSNNTVTGGAGNDIIILDNAKSSVIDYAQGDSIDALYGYGVGDIIKIKGEYSKQISGNDVILQVANGGIIVKDSKDLKININRIEVEEDESLPSESSVGFNPLEGGLIEMPSFWNTANAIRGTSANNRFENNRDNVIIYGLSGDDTIINYGRNVTINAGDGNDQVKNYGENVEINSGNGNDYIYNEAEDATITGGNGNDTIDNIGDNSDIDGRADMNSINNSATNVRLYSYSDTS